MSIVGIKYADNQLDYILSTEGNYHGTNEMYLYEMYTLLKKEQISNVCFSYNHIGTENKTELVVGEWTPKSFSKNFCGKIAKDADDILKEYLSHISAMSKTTKLVEAFSNPNLKSGDQLTVNFKGGVSRLRILLDSITTNTYDNSFSIEKILLKLEYDKKDYAGTLIPIDFLQNILINGYNKEIEDITNNRENLNHPYTELKKVIVAQHLANHCIKNNIEIKFYPSIEMEYKHFLINNEFDSSGIETVIKYEYDNYQTKIWECREQNVGCAILSKNEFGKDKSFYYLVKALYNNGTINYELTIYSSLDENSISGMNFFGTSTTLDAKCGGVVLDVNQSKFIINGNKKMNYVSLNQLYNNNVVKVEKWISPLNFQFGNLISGIVTHSGVIVTLSGGERYLIHKGNEFGKKSQTVITYLDYMIGDWKKESELAVNKSKKVIVGDLIKLGGANYNVFKDNCNDASERIMNYCK